jgi:ATP-dependent exoDNAse (exonuclease V) beta subunit
MLTTSKPAPLKRLTVTTGFPSPSDAKKRGSEQSVLKNHKQDMLDAIAIAAQSGDFIDALIEVQQLPEPSYNDEQWQLLSELLTVLPDLLAELQWVFAQHRQVDFTEIAERAQRALGTSDEPTDLALAMDLGLQHVLVDEFQDTSQTQFTLFKRLVDGWTPDDGRTFFAVGDPMQSIYRFRDGDVTLFSQAQQHGIGPVALESLTLSVNFRSAPQLIDWVNQTFTRIFPDRADPDTGAVPYSPSQAFLKKPGRIDVHALVDAQDNQEASLVAELCAQAIRDDSEHKVAILVRSRSHAVPVLAGLREAGLPYQSVDMDPIGERAVVRDLVSLVLAFRYPHDRLHWLAVLRSPSVGLTLQDLHP